MKKYLMTGIAALAMCAAFTSCSHDVEPVTPEQLNQMEAEKAFQKYETAFISAFGQPAATQTWGFSGAAFTRTENANANEWADPDKAYGGLLVPPAITPTQAAVVKAYFQNVPKLGYDDPQWSNYFIQQVYKGNPETAGANSPEKYLAADGQNYILASDHMDHLLAIDPDRNFVDHINNFNHGDCSPNGDVLDNGEHVGGKHHEDKIMYMMNSTTKSFAYHNSDGSLYHTEYTGLVSWETIHNWAKTNYKDNDGKDYDGCLKDDWNRSYMGFDFEQIVGDDVYSKNIEYDYSGGWKDEYNTTGWPIKSITYNTWRFDADGDGVEEEYKFLKNETNMYAADLKEESYKQKNGSTSTTGGKANFNDTPSDDIIRDLLSKGYLPYTDTKKDWVKVGGTADGYFSDWIVTLTEAKTNIPKPKRTSLRVMAEDLSAQQASDFDFNDIVFDVFANEGGTSATIVLKAAGGTLPLRINENDAWEVHKLFDVPVNTMVNTGAAARGLTGEDNKGDVTVTTSFVGDFSAENFCETVGKIKIEVYKNGQWMELSAKQGEAACKFGTDPANKWVPELENIDDYYNFSEWVQGFTATLTAKKTW